MRFRTNAKTIHELDLALLEAGALSGDEPTYRHNRVIEIAEVIPPFEQILDRAAWLDGTLTPEDEIDRPTKWHDIRQAIPDGLTDHSTHNLFPFEGKMTPKLARTLINVCVGTSKLAGVVDPFCGSGTVLLEASIMGHVAFGCDSEPFAAWLSDTKTQGVVELTERLTRMTELFMIDARRAEALLQARSLALPRPEGVVIKEMAAQDFLYGYGGLYPAIVTSPPYFDAIDYHTRHLEYCRKLGLTTDDELGLGVCQPILVYHRDIDVIAGRMANIIAIGGRIALVIGDTMDVPSSDWWELALKSNGLRRYARLTRPYENATRGFAHDVILVMEKV